METITPKQYIGYGYLCTWQQGLNVRTG